MKKHKKEDQFLEQIRKIPNISLACENVGLSRQTIYRWCQEDPEFEKRLEEAKQVGLESINDLAESKLVSNINSGSQRAIEYWLGNNKRNYIKPREARKLDFEEKTGNPPVTKIEVHVLPKDTKNVTVSHYKESKE